MTSTMKMVVAALVAAGVWGLLELIFNPANLLSILVGIAAGVAVVIMLLARSRGETPQAVAKEVVAAAQAAVSEPKTRVDERAAQEQLFRACEAFVLSGAATNFGPALEAVAAKLRQLLPRALGFAPESETTFNVVKLAREDIPRQLSAYVDMSPTDRDANRESLKAQWVTLMAKLDKLAEIIDRGRADQFESESAFIDMKF